MINLYGTSHVSKESIELIDRKIEEDDPDVIALELDYIRLKALLDQTNGSRNDSKNLSLFLKLVKKFQNKIGSKTGVMPGQEMIYAYEKAMERDLEVALIDQDIRVTLDRLKTVSKREKVKASLSLIISYIIPFGKVDLSGIPDEERINELLEEMKKRYPGLYRVLVAERNNVMIDSLLKIQEENPEKDITAFVGAAHKKDVQEQIKERQGEDDGRNNYQSSLEETSE